MKHLTKESRSSLVRCPWVPLDDELYKHYHDTEWGVPLHDDSKLFELIVLEGAQAGLSWRTVLHKRNAYRQSFFNFDVQKVAAMTVSDVDQLMLNAGLIRNRLKLTSAIKNAQSFIAIQKEFGSFASYLWTWTNNTVIVNKPTSIKEYAARSELSDVISKDLKKRGFSFVGTTIIYAYLQSTGVVNDHSIDCFCFTSRTS